MKNGEISKTQKKLQQRNAKKYYKKALNSLKEFENVNIISDPSKCLFIGNGGMLCGQTRENILTLCAIYGVVEDLVMIPKKSFSFVQYQNIASAEKAVIGLDGYNPLPKVNNVQPVVAPFHIQRIGVSSLDFLRDLEQNVNQYPMEDEDRVLVDGLSLVKDFVDAEYEKELFEFFHKECSALEGWQCFISFKFFIFFIFYT